MVKLFYWDVEMLLVLSPAKTLDYTTPVKTDIFTRPDFIPRSAELIDTLMPAA
jgi:cytoplasmic iron level regulating protein YaaA (DUF328/UPF0246 family)